MPAPPSKNHHAATRLLYASLYHDTQFFSLEDVLCPVPRGHPALDPHFRGSRTTSQTLCSEHVHVSEPYIVGMNPIRFCRFAGRGRRRKGSNSIHIDAIESYFFFQKEKESCVAYSRVRTSDAYRSSAEKRPIMSRVPPSNPASSLLLAVTYLCPLSSCAGAKTPRRCGLANPINRAAMRYRRRKKKEVLTPAIDKVPNHSPWC